jgi:hypothetical protein
VVMERRAARSEVAWDCCTRVLSRSAGWSKVAVRAPETRPAVKWKAVGKEEERKR